VRLCSPASIAFAESMNSSYFRVRVGELRRREPFQGKEVEHERRRAWSGRSASIGVRSEYVSLHTHRASGSRSCSKALPEDTTVVEICFARDEEWPSLFRKARFTVPARDSHGAAFSTSWAPAITKLKKIRVRHRFKGFSRGKAALKNGTDELDEEVLQGADRADRFSHRDRAVVIVSYTALLGTPCRFMRP